MKKRSRVMMKTYMHMHMRLPVDVDAVLHLNR
jgi:hypothetical protein